MQIEPKAEIGKTEEVYRHRLLLVLTLSRNANSLCNKHSMAYTTASTKLHLLSATHVNINYLYY